MLDQPKRPFNGDSRFIALFNTVKDYVPAGALLHLHPRGAAGVAEAIMTEFEEQDWENAIAYVRGSVSVHRQDADNWMEEYRGLLDKDVTIESLLNGWKVAAEG